VVESAFLVPAHVTDIAEAGARPGAEWDAGFDAGAFVKEHAAEFRREFGAARLEETAFPVYANRLPIARWLGLERIRAAALLARRVGAVDVAVDFGAGLGVSLPGLAARARRVWAVERDAEVTRFALSRLGLTGIVESMREVSDRWISCSPSTSSSTLPSSAGTGRRPRRPGTSRGRCWVISDSTENRLYGLMRRIARTSGKGHVRGVDRVLEIVSARMAHVDQIRLPADTVAGHVAVRSRPLSQGVARARRGSWR
jgi:hypothetical protein